MAESLRPIRALDSDLRARATTGLVAGIGIGGAAPELEPDPIHVEALAFRRLGEQAEALGDVAAAIGHYARAVELWREVGCRRRLQQLRK